MAREVGIVGAGATPFRGKWYGKTYAEGYNIVLVLGWRKLALDER